MAELSIERQREIGRPFPGVSVQDMTRTEYVKWADWFNRSARWLAHQRGVLVLGPVSNPAKV